MLDGPLANTKPVAQPGEADHDQFQEVENLGGLIRKSSDSFERLVQKPRGIFYSSKASPNVYSGIYIARLVTPEYTQSIMLVLLK